MILTELRQFISSAERERKYPPNTATGFRAALSMFEPELNEQEKESLQIFKEHVDDIYMSVYRKNKVFNSKTLLEYKRRILRLMTDYEQYGTDPNKMASWTPARRISKKAIKKSSGEKPSASNAPNTEKDEESNTPIVPVVPSVTMNRFEITLRPNIRAIILTPADLKSEEAIKIKKYIEYLESVAEV